MIKFFINILVALAFSLNSFAQVSLPKANPLTSSRGSNYYVGLDLGKPLIRVNILSGVTQPGVYHIPIGTNISELISYAGGARSGADLSQIQIRSTASKTEFNSTKINLSGLLSEKNGLPALKDKDIIYIPQEQGLGKTIQWLTLASLAMSVVSAIVVISEND